jgi:thioredoxin 1
MSRVVIPNNAEEYNQNINKPDTIILVDYFATWCEPCKQISPYYEALSNAYTDLTFMKIDIDQFDDLEDIQKIRGVPNFKFFLNGTIIKEHSGGDPQILENIIVDIINKYYE